MTDPLDLSAILAAHRARKGDAYMAPEREIARLLREADMPGRAVAVGEPAPVFTLPDTDGNLVSSPDLLERGPLVVSFQRGRWCSFCRLEYRALAAALPDIHALGAELVAVTAEKAEIVRTYRDDLAPGMHVLVDSDNGAALAFGLVYRIPDAYQTLFRSAGLDLTAIYGNGGWFLPLPATYVIGRDGIVRHAFVDADPFVRLDPRDIVATLRSLRDPSDRPVPRSGEA